MNYFVWINHYVDGSVPLEDISVNHRNYLQMHEKIILGGSYLDRTGGMLLIFADDLLEARAIAEGDPMVIHGHLKYEIHEWNMQLNNFLRIVK